MVDIHRPVMLKEVLTWLKPHPGGIYLDGTIGAGGHSGAILEAAGPDGRLIGLDRDAFAVASAREKLAPFGERVMIVQAEHKNAAEVLRGLAPGGIDGALLDLGLSSMQLDQAARGFSFMAEGPLDMRMDQRESRRAADLVNRLPEQDLTRMLFEYGEERYARRIARAIIRRRERDPILTTFALVDVLRGTVPPAYLHGRLHFATRTFQALRIAVNRELDDLGSSLRLLAGCLRPGGRLAVLSFHSLEDRIVKHAFRALAAGESEPPAVPGRARGAGASEPLPRGARAPVGMTGMTILTKRPLTPSARECAENPRARSAKLRVLERAFGCAEASVGGTRKPVRPGALGVGGCNLGIGAPAEGRTGPRWNEQKCCERRESMEAAA